MPQTKLWNCYLRRCIKPKEIANILEEKNRAQQLVESNRLEAKVLKARLAVSMGSNWK